MKFIADPKFRLILSTAPNLEEARRLAHTLLERRLIACANLVPGVESLYRWEGKLESSAEVLLLMKTERDKEEELFQVLSEIHGYQVPEGLSLPIHGGLEPYLQWVKASLVID